MSSEIVIQVFSATIEAADQGGAFVSVPFDVEAVFGKKRVKVVATFDGVSYRGSLVRMGRPCHFMPIRKDIRAQIGKDIGDRVEVTVREDTEPRVVPVPDDVATAWKAAPEVQMFFETLSYTHQKEYVRWVEEAKRLKTRERRIHKTIEMLRAGQKGR